MWGTLPGTAPSTMKADPGELSILTLWAVPDPMGTDACSRETEAPLVRIPGELPAFLVISFIFV